MEIIWKNIDKFCTPIDEESHFSKKLKTNIKGVWKIEWYTPPFCDCPSCNQRYAGGGFGLGFDGYDVPRVKPNKERYSVGFVTKKEADEYYKKAAKRPSKTKVLKPQKSEAAVYIASRKEIERRIHEYAEKRGVLKSGFDVEIVRTS